MDVAAKMLLWTLMLLATCFSNCVFGEGEAPIVTVNEGSIQGIQETSVSGKTFYSYMKIPYAKPPVGDLRLKNPQPPEKWEGVLDGTKMPSPCIQYDFFDVITNPNPTQIGKEDCLHLNVFTSKPNEPLGNLPVMVFIHGGAFFGGYSAMYPPYALMNEEIVLVVLQYRLGILGFMSTEDEVIPGNFGLKDQSLALKWVQMNIDKFGGDPLRVTIFGESAGGASVHYQILSHHSIGLFTRAISMSGNAMCPWSMGSYHRRIAEDIGGSFNCTLSDGSEKFLSCLQEVDAETLTSKFLGTILWAVFPIVLGPRVDKDFLMDEPDNLMKNSRHKKLNYMTGITRDDGSLVTYPVYANEGLRTAFKYQFPEVASILLELREWDVARYNQTIKILDRYVGGVKVGAEDADKISEMFNDRFMRVCHDLLVMMYSKNAGPAKKTYYYEVHHRGQYSVGDLFGIDLGKNWVTHADDLLYLFHGGPVFNRPLQTEEDKKMREIMLKLWYNFACTGNPTPDDSLGFIWEPATPESLNHLEITLNPVMREDTSQEIRNFWTSLPTKQNLLLFPERIANLSVVPVEEPAEDDERPKQKDEF